MSNRTTHGMRYTKTYSSWIEMNKRCNNKNHASYKWYGAQGISVCDSWKNSFVNFFEDMGECPIGMSIDRIDNDLGYSKENCRWATDKEQTHNRKCQEFYEHDGLKLTLPEWSEKLGINYRTLNSRIKRTGLSFSDAISHSFGKITECGMKKIKQAVTKSNIARGDKTVSAGKGLK